MASIAKIHRYPHTSQQVAACLLGTGAVKLSPEQPFTWASGWKSPIYCDNRLTLSFPVVRKLIVKGMVDTIQHSGLVVEAIAGVATAGIPWASMVADALDLPLLYVRSKPKDHGMGNMIEGKVEEGLQVIVIEDLISTGGSSLQAASALQAAGVEVMAMLAVFTYQFPQSEKAFQKAKIPLLTLSNYEDLLAVAHQEGQVTKEMLKTLSLWRKSPDTWMQ